MIVRFTGRCGVFSSLKGIPLTLLSTASLA
jgi:hypothetical protein